MIPYYKVVEWHNAEEHRRLSNPTLMLLPLPFTGWMDTWRSFYNSEPFLDGRLTEEMKSRVLGGAAEQWSEQVDASSIESRIWPRALAIAERLW